MKKSLSHYRLITGIKSIRPNPIVINRNDPEMVEAVQPEVAEQAFEAEVFDKDYAFDYIQSRWFQRRLYLGEQLSLTADHFKMICDEVHEMGRIREKQVSGCNCPIED